MSRISGATEEMEEAVRGLVDAVTNDGDEYDASQELLQTVAGEGNAAQQEEAIELITTLTEYTKGTVKDWLGETKDEYHRDMLDVNKVSKYVPPGDDDYVWEFEVVARGNPATFRIETGDLMTQKVFCQKLFEATDTKVDFEEWDAHLNEWMAEAEVEELGAPPIELEHGLARRIVENIGEAEATTEYETFKKTSSKVLLNDSEKEVWVRSELIDSTLAGTSGEVSRRRLRAILDDVMSGSSQKVRAGDGFVYAWRFDMDALESTDVVDMDALRESAKEDGDES